MSTDDPTSTDTPHPLDRRQEDGEKPHHHRCLLLWAMQDPDARSFRAVGRAVSRSDSAIRKWRTRHDWQGRVEAAGETVQQEAIARYRRRYFHRWGPSELASVERNMSVPMLPGEPAPDGEGEATKHAKQRALEEPENRRRVRQHVAVLDFGIAEAVKRIKAGKARLSPRDLLHFMRLRHELADTLSPAPVAAAGGVVESARVRIARANDEDVVDALHADAQELVAITSALRSRKDAAGEVVAFPVDEDRSQEEAG